MLIKLQWANFQLGTVIGGYMYYGYVFTKNNDYACLDYNQSKWPLSRTLLTSCYLNKKRWFIYVTTLQLWELEKTLRSSERNLVLHILEPKKPLEIWINFFLGIRHKFWLKDGYSKNFVGLGLCWTSSYDFY